MVYFMATSHKIMIQGAGRDAWDEMPIAAISWRRGLQFLYGLIIILITIVNRC